MITPLVVLLAIACLALGFGFGKNRSAVAESKLTSSSTSRREAAQRRLLPEQKDHLLTREVMAGHRRFFVDLDQGEKERYIRISELETRKGKQQEAYTVLIYEREIAGLYRALGDIVKAL